MPGLKVLRGLSSDTPQISSKNLCTSKNTSKLQTGGLLRITGCQRLLSGEKSQLAVSAQGRLKGGG